MDSRLLGTWSMIRAGADLPAEYVVIEESGRMFTFTYDAHEERALWRPVRYWVFSSNDSILSTRHRPCADARQMTYRFEGDVLLITMGSNEWSLTKLSQAEIPSWMEERISQEHRHMNEREARDGLPTWPSQS